MPRLAAIVASVVLALSAAFASSAATGADVTVFTAASLKEALDEQARQFAANTGNKVIVSYGASNALAKQIDAAAPADIFISADLDWMDYVGQRNLIAPGMRFNLLRNTLVLIAPASSKATLQVAPGFGLATRQADLSCEGVVGMHLDRQGFVGEQQLQQQCRFRCLWVSALEPYLADRRSVVTKFAPRAQIGPSPGLADNPFGSKFKSHCRCLADGEEL